MTFTVAEDIKKKLTDNFNIDKVFKTLENGDFETGDMTGWTGLATSHASGLPTASANAYHIQAGSFGCALSYFLSGPNTFYQGYIEQTNLFIPVSLVTSLTWWSIQNASSDGITLTVTYDDGTTTTELDNIETGVYAQWSITVSNLTPERIITGLKWQAAQTPDPGSQDMGIDTIVLTLSSPLPSSINIQLLNDVDAEATTFEEGGSILISREQLLRIDQHNGSRSETFLVDIAVYLDTTDWFVDTPLLLKNIVSELDRVLDVESIAHTSYFYKIRYDWLGNYHNGVINLQVEVLNALVTRPGLL